MMAVTIADPDQIEDAVTVGIDRSLGVYSILIDWTVDMGPDQAEAVALAILEQVSFLRLATSPT